MNRAEIREQAKKQLDDLFKKIDEVEAQQERVKGDARARFEKELGELKARRKELEGKYRELETASEEKLDQIDKALQDSAKSFKEGLNRLKGIFS